MQAVQAQYFACKPVRQITWKGIDWTSLELQAQQELLRATVLHTWSQQYPASLAYRRTFLKHIISELETSAVEVCDEVYESYTEVLSRQEGADKDRCFKTYLLADHSPIHLRESTNLISSGTTGLQTWQAAKNLAEWCLEHPDKFQNKRVLELGSGLGLTGLAVCHHCQPWKFLFTDCHPDVLELLTENIKRNVEPCPSEKELLPNSAARNKDSGFDRNCQEVTQKHEEDTCDVTKLDSIQDIEFRLGRWTTCVNCCSSKQRLNSELCSGTEADQLLHIELLKLDWETVSDAKLSSLGKDVDVVMAADVVYDTSIIPALVRVLRSLLSSSGGLAYVASTVRNSETRDCFLQALDEARICQEELPGPQLNCFHYDKSVPVQILQLSLNA